MEELFRSYLNFLRSMRQGLESLTTLNATKLAAAQTDDLMALNDLLNQEQAQALNFRGLERERDKLLPQLGLVLKVPDRFPPALQDEARREAEALRNQYVAYRQAAAKTRAVLEKNLQEVEYTLAEMGASPMETGPGYQKKTESAPPPSMKTDFRA